MRPYVVRAGDTLGRIARAAGQSPETVWSHPRNAALKSQRPHPEVLLPGDIVHLPDAPPEGARFQRGADNRYRADVPQVVARVALRLEGAALVDEAVVLMGAGEPRALRSDGDGRVELTVPLSAEHVELVLVDRGVTIPVAIGHLDPADTLSGQRQRLHHLGFLEAAHGGDDLSSAVAAFQRAQRIAVTGALDEDTRAALVRAHGG